MYVFTPTVTSTKHSAQLSAAVLGKDTWPKNVMITVKTVWSFWTRLKHNKHAKSATIAFSVSVLVVSRGYNSHCVQATAWFIHIRVLTLHNNPRLEMYKECRIPNTKQMETLESYSIIRSHACQMEQNTHPRSEEHSINKSKQPHPLGTPSFSLISLQPSVVSVCVSMFWWHPKTCMPFLCRQKRWMKQQSVYIQKNSAISNYMTQKTDCLHKTSTKTFNKVLH